MQITVYNQEWLTIDHQGTNLSRSIQQPRDNSLIICGNASKEKRVPGQWADRISDQLSIILWSFTLLHGGLIHYLKEPPWVKDLSSTGAERDFVFVSAPVGIDFFFIILLEWEIPFQIRFEHEKEIEITSSLTFSTCFLRVRGWRSKGRDKPRNRSYILFGIMAVSSVQESAVFFYLSYRRSVQIHYKRRLNKRDSAATLKIRLLSRRYTFSFSFYFSIDRQMNRKDRSMSEREKERDSSLRITCPSWSSAHSTKEWEEESEENERKNRRRDSYRISSMWRFFVFFFLTAHHQLLLNKDEP